MILSTPPRALERRVARLESAAPPTPPAKRSAFFREVESLRNWMPVGDLGRLVQLVKLRNQDPCKLAETDPARIALEIILENARRVRDYGRSGQVEPRHGLAARLQVLGDNDLTELTTLMHEALARELVDIGADAFISGCVSELFENAGEWRSRGAPTLKKSQRRVRDETAAWWFLGAEHQDMLRFRPNFVELSDDELERLVNYLERDANVWPSRDWIEWPPFPRLKDEQVRDLVASFPSYPDEADRRAEPLTRDEEIDAGALAAKVRLGVYRADWSKLSHLVAGKRFYAPTDSHLLPKNGITAGITTRVRDRTIGRSSLASNTGCRVDPRIKASASRQNERSAARANRPDALKSLALVVLFPPLFLRRVLDGLKSG
jgi:hypothetical protein